MNMRNGGLQLLFDEFQKLPKGVLIDAPDEPISQGFLVSSKISFLFFPIPAKAYFTRRTLKHLSEKGSEGRLLFEHIPIVLKSPNSVYEGDKTRILVGKSTDFEKEGEFYVVVLESVNNRELVIVTSFVAKQKYLKNFEILWRTAASP